MLPAIDQAVLNGARAANTAGVANLRGLGCLSTTHTVRWDDGVGAGVVVLEVADDVTFTGTWQLMQTFPFAGPNRVDVYKLDGPYKAIRHRITEDIVGGTVTSRIMGSM
jgi:hypothetical protein